MNNEIGTFNFATDKYRVYDFHFLADAIRFCKMFGGRFAYSLAAPVDRHIVIID